MYKKWTSFFQTQPFYSISEINWWLLKFSDDFKVSAARSANNNTVEIADGLEVQLPPLPSYATEDDSLVSLYTALDELTEIYKFEDYAKEELLKYYQLEIANENFEQWIGENEKVYDDKLVLFNTNYLEYSLDDTEITHLLAFSSKKENLDIYIDRSDFKNLIQFTLLFEAHYYNNHSLLAKLK